MGWFSLSTTERARLLKTAQANANANDRDYVIFFDTSGNPRIEPYDAQIDAHKDPIAIARPTLPSPNYRKED